MTANPFSKSTIIQMKFLIVKAAFPHARIIVGVIWESDNRIAAVIAPMS